MGGATQRLCHVAWPGRTPRQGGEGVSSLFREGMVPTESLPVELIARGRTRS